MTVKEYRTEIKKTLEVLFGDQAGGLCDVLLSAFTDMDFSELILNGDRQVSEEIMQKTSDAIDELGMGIPVQYIIGSCWFYGIKLAVGKGCFIPRSDTENLVKAAIAALPQNGSFADICSGSGCITAAMCENRPDAKGFALELSRKALVFTEKNLEKYPNAAIKRFDALDDEDYYALYQQEGRLDMILCNPPYIKRDDIDHLQQQVQYEPHTALDGGEDGLTYYREIIRLSPILLKEDGVIMFELGINQAPDVGGYFKEAGMQSAVIKDINGIDRIILAKKY